MEVGINYLLPGVWDNESRSIFTDGGALGNTAHCQPLIYRIVKSGQILLLVHIVSNRIKQRQVLNALEKGTTYPSTFQYFL